MTHCNICKRLLENPQDPYSRDCGGDCLLCMANMGDPDCLASVIRIHSLSDKTDAELMAFFESRWVTERALLDDLADRGGTIAPEEAQQLQRKMQDAYARLDRIALDRPHKLPPNPDLDKDIPDLDDGLDATDHLLSTEANARALLESIAQFERGETTERALLEQMAQLDSTMRDRLDQLAVIEMKERTRKLYAEKRAAGHVPFIDAIDPDFIEIGEMIDAAAARVSGELPRTGNLRDFMTDDDVNRLREELAELDAEIARVLAADTSETVAQRCRRLEALGERGQTDFTAVPSGLSEEETVAWFKARRKGSK